ncbi:hypothetical protein IFM89_016936 [Coptis chinensis]|uniref:Uncharacterized protein n=1 Tax=Coptis chinensis TaxID=261450 RepID=A0A835LI97_9MAGN|nr:hypothetical protein IFM89_016936 [Coptis chinensis]
MTYTTDDIAEEISFQSLDDDCRLLGSLLNDVLQREVGPQVMEKMKRLGSLLSGIAPKDLYDTYRKRAHPTKINRRTLQYKHIRIVYLLEYNARADLSHEDRDMLIEDLNDELKRHNPTPIDEARAGLHIVEQSLWQQVPVIGRRVAMLLRRYTLQLQHLGKPLPLTCTPIKFGSWMGGDRDGNSNVTAKVRLSTL